MTAKSPSDPAEAEVPLPESGGSYLFDPGTGAMKALPDDQEAAARAISRAEKAAAQPEPTAGKPADSQKGA